jgi:hypothetical protein
VVATPIPATVGSVVDGHRVFSAGTEGHTLALLDDGRVLKVGGRLIFPAHHYTVSTVEIFDPDELRWTSVAPLPSSPAITLADEDFGDGSRAWHAATRLGDGRVLIVGGDTASHRFEPPSAGYTYGRFLVSTEQARRSSLIYDPVADRYEHGPGLDMVMGRGGHDLMQLPDGGILAIGGHRLHDEATSWFTEPTVDRLDPVTLAWSTLRGGDMPSRTVTSQHYGLTNAHGPVAVGLLFSEVQASAIVGDGRYLLVSGWDWMGRTTDLSLLFTP